jgi:hypothetical protein
MTPTRKDGMKIEMTAAEASDILDDLKLLDGMWVATLDLHESLEAIVLDNQAKTWQVPTTSETDTTLYATPEELNRRWYVGGYPE